MNHEEEENAAYFAALRGELACVETNCKTCDGKGNVKVDCKTCEGEGSRACECDTCGHDHRSHCYACKGAGAIVGGPCPACDGKGKVARLALPHPSLLPAGLVLAPRLLFSETQEQFIAARMLASGEVPLARVECSVCKGHGTLADRLCGACLGDGTRVRVLKAHPADVYVASLRECAVCLRRMPEIGGDVRGPDWICTACLATEEDDSDERAA